MLTPFGRKFRGMIDVPLPINSDGFTTTRSCNTDSNKGAYKQRYKHYNKHKQPKAIQN